RPGMVLPKVAPLAARFSAVLASHPLLGGSGDFDEWGPRDRDCGRDALVLPAQKLSQLLRCGLSKGTSGVNEASHYGASRF
ncbi:MAG: hypothetical protein VXZ55_00775, partial [Planctomycetota bacterium]|nr:hypothetical protein [Planctomycetota bacterium]